MDLAGGEPRCLTEDLDRSVESPVWAPDNSGIFVAYDDEGDTRLVVLVVEG